MRIVIQCAGKKHPQAGSLQTADGRPVRFVSQPLKVEDCDDRTYARPDDISDDGRTWRERLLEYNASRTSNPLGLRPAYELYTPPEYRRLEGWAGTENLFILSAGWGLIPAGFLTPDYNITFNAGADAAFRRRREHVFHDSCLLDLTSLEPLVFLGGKDYAPHFARLTNRYRGPRTILYNSAQEPAIEKLHLVRYETPRRTNWHYEAANALIDGKLRLPGTSHSL
jgi:hypothetical protein